MEVALKVKNLTINYGSNNVLQDATFILPKGGLNVLMGMNGSGKTTLLRAICGNIKPAKGEIMLFDKPQSSMKRAQLGKTVSYIPQTHTPIFRYTVLDFVLMGAAASKNIFQQPTKNEKNNAIEIINQLSLQKYTQTDYSTLSGGERQLTLIARGLMQSAPLLLLDEPVASLDFINQHSIMKVLKKLSEQSATIFTALHDPNLALNYADRIIFLNNKSVTAVLSRGKTSCFVSEFEKVLNSIYKGIQISNHRHFEVVV